MDDKEGKATVGKTINSWHSLGTARQAILLIGPSHTGRTTLAELVRKYIYGNPHPKLAYEIAKNNEGKYNLEGIISAKSIKVQTIYPALYEKSHKDKDELKIIDVPSFVYPPENKKWSLLEQKLNVDLMVAHSQAVGFLLFIEEKSTRTNPIPWKKAIINFLELFRPESLNDDSLLNSIGMAITKAPPETNKETMINRLKQLQTTLVKEKHPLLGPLDRIFKNIIEKSRIIIFKKVSDDPAEKEGIIANMAQLEKMANYTINKDHIKEQPWQPEGEKAVGEYFSSLVDPALRSLAKVTKEILALPDFSPDNLKKAKQQWRESVQDVAVCDEVKQRLEPKSGLRYLPFIKNYAQLAQQYTKVTPGNIEPLIQAVTKLGIFDNNDEAPFQIIYEGLQFRKIEEFKQFQLEPYCNAFAELFSEPIQNEVYKKLALAESGNEKKEFYQDAIDFIQSLPTPPAALAELQEIYKKKLIKFANPKEALQLYAKELSSEKNKAKQFALASDIALILSNKGLKGEAGQVYRASRNTHSALQYLREAAESDQKVAVEYISYLAELTLFEKAVLFCYQSAARFGYDSRQQFSKSLKEVEAARKKYMTEGIKINDFGSEIESKKVIEIATSSLQKL